MIRRPPRSTQSRSSAASDVYKRQIQRDRQEVVAMKRLIAMAAILLACGALFAIPTAAEASGFIQRGPQGEARTVVGHVLDGRKLRLKKAIVYLKKTAAPTIKTWSSDT